MMILVSCSGKDDQETDGWDTCFDCTTQSWIGIFQGSGTNYNAVNNTTVKDLSVTISISETSPDYLLVTINLPDYYHSTVSGEVMESHYITFSGSNNSISATMYKSDHRLKISGNAKRFHVKVNEIVIEQVVNFDAIKVIQ
jgi:hypothetical protein